MNTISKILLPLSLVYGFVMFIRNKLFDIGILKTRKFNFPVICVGNITVGGTGKTPHIEYLTELISSSARVAILSRGYKRKTRGFVLANKNSTPDTIGDEPFQLYKKFKKIYVAVCESRVTGAEKLLEEKKKTEVILLDDAFQHRYINPGLSVLLLDYNRPVFNDFLLPAGRLRESISSKKRAQIVIVTKSPENLNSQIINYWRNNLKLEQHQHLFFSTFEYRNILPVFKPEKKFKSLNTLSKNKVKVLLVTGIAYPQPLIKKLKLYQIDFQSLVFPDHHEFDLKDFQRIKQHFKSIKGRNKIILTTEKDAVRMKHNKSFPVKLKEFCYFISIKVSFLNESSESFNNIVLKYVSENKRIG